MHRFAAVVCVLLTGMLASQPAQGQEAGRVALATGYPSTIGVVWHVSDGLALRPEVTVQKMTGDSSAADSSVTTTSDGWTVGAGVSGLFYLQKWDELRSYVSPRFLYSRSATDNAYSPSSSGGPLSTSRSSTYSVTGSYGLQYALARRFSIFGEAGFGYSHLRTTYTSPAMLSSSYRSTSTTNTWATRTAVGVLFYF